MVGFMNSDKKKMSQLTSWCAKWLSSNKIKLFFSIKYIELAYNNYNTYQPNRYSFIF